MGREFVREFRQAIRDRRFGVILLDDSDLLAWSWFWPVFGEEIDAAYAVKSKLAFGDDEFWPRSGARTRPTLLLVPKDRRDPSDTRSSVRGRAGLLRADLADGPHQVVEAGDEDQGERHPDRDLQDRVLALELVEEQEESGRRPLGERGQLSPDRGPELRGP